MHRYFLWALTLLLLTCPVVQAAAPTKPPVRPTTQQNNVAPVVSAAAIPLLKQGISAFSADQLSQAEHYFKQALNHMGPSDGNRVVVASNLTNIYRLQKRYPEALVWAEKTIPLMAKRHGADSIQVAEAIYLSANTQHALNDTAKAEAGYLRSLAVADLPKNAGKPFLGTISAWENLGNIACQARQFDKAFTYYQKAFTLQEQNPQKSSETLYENVGVFYQNQNKSEEAVQYYTKALALYQQKPTVHQAAIQRVTFKLANMQGTSVKQAGGESQYDGQFFEAGKKAYNVERNYEDAAQQFKLALAEVNRAYPDQKAFIASLEAILGKALYSADEPEEAIPYLEKARAYYSAQEKSNHSALLEITAFLGFASNKLGDYAAGQQHLQQVRANGSALEPMFYGSVLTALANSLEHQGQFHDAKTLYEEALALYSQSGSENTQQIKSIQYQLALLDKMFKSRQGIAELVNYSKDGLRRWSMEKGPIYIRLNTGESLPGWEAQYVDLMRRAFLEWEQALPEHIRFQFTDNPDKVDVVVNWTDRPLSQTDVDAKVGIHKLTVARTFFLSSEIVISLSNNGKPRTEKELYATALHEVGHMLGLQHSSHLADIMAEVNHFAIPSNGWPTLSANDIQAARFLYQQTPVLTNPQGITLSEYRQFYKVADVGIEALKSQDYKQASRVFEQARTLYKDDPYINYYAGLSVFQAGDYKEAREIFETLTMPPSTPGFSVDSQLGLIYVELGHKYNKWGRKNKAISNEFYDKGVIYLRKALHDTEVAVNQRAYLYEKLREGENRKRPEPVYTWEVRMPNRGLYGWY